jgi:hypothetical protein
MWANSRDFEQALDRASLHAKRWLQELPDRPVKPSAAVEDVARKFGGPLPATGIPPVEVIDFLAEHAEPGLMSMQSGRFFGWVIGGTLPAAMAAEIGRASCRERV